MACTADPGWPRVGLVGRGRAGQSLAVLLERAGLTPSWHWSRGDALDPLDLPEVDVVWFVVADAAIEAAATRLAARPSASREVWLHASGSRPGDVVRVDARVPGAAGALHPLQALPGPLVPPDHLAGATAGLDGDPRALAMAEHIAQRLGMVPRRLAPGTKPLYHAAAVSVAGHATALFAQAVTMLEACGLTRPEARDALLPLARGALVNLAAGLPEAVVTGPIARGDVETVAGHLTRLDALDPHLAATYRALATTALALSRPALDPARAAALDALLAD